MCMYSCRHKYACIEVLVYLCKRVYLHTYVNGSGNVLLPQKEMVDFVTLSVLVFFQFRDRQRDYDDSANWHLDSFNKDNKMHRYGFRNHHTT